MEPWNRADSQTAPRGIRFPRIAEGPARRLVADVPGLYFKFFVGRTQRSL